VRFRAIKTSGAGRARTFENSRKARPLLAGYSLCFAVALAFAGCAGKPFEVKNRADLPPASASAATAQSNRISLQAEVIRDEDYLNDTFDANLILAGVLPVRLKVTNGGPEPVDLNKARFEVKAANGRAYKSAEAKKAFKRVVAYYEISTYSKPGYRESLEAFTAYALDLSKPLGPQESREGLVFFVVPDAVARASGLSMVADRLDRNGAAVELNLN
jgi:hypothetical protein